MRQGGVRVYNAWRRDPVKVQGLGITVRLWGGFWSLHTRCIDKSACTCFRAVCNCVYIAGLLGFLDGSCDDPDSCLFFRPSRRLASVG